MSPLDLFYSIGEAVEELFQKVVNEVKEIVRPTPARSPPDFRILRRLVRRDITIHELLSLKLQLVFITYLLLSLMIVLASLTPLLLLALFFIEVLYIRYLVKKNWDFFTDPRPYYFFYSILSVISFLAFLGYLLLRRFATNVYYYYGYLIGVLIVVLLFRWYFKEKYGRDYTYGIVEEVKGDLVRVFVNDDLAANVKPGRYWVPAVPDAEQGRVVKLLVEERTLRGSVPVRIIEVYLGQSSHTSTLPNEDTE
ncbi:hypothetical protein X802_06545 [Thermococcus guaymasensis DSM 11113]|uniref:DUF2101 domain-containing protein n=1 Tax=Thermococcus guaymasensis DSM 11113 TaxID=1432656 RepID=A0A0X1KKT0_9EURY|nr:DUF2101 family protein [Thermococcus guaymasensis]AJC71857.1 hypothetical protein X802_06545 [Thermococcus guaymasensis DSM 11113]